MIWNDVVRVGRKCKHYTFDGDHPDKYSRLRRQNALVSTPPIVFRFGVWDPAASPPLLQNVILDRGTRVPPLVPCYNGSQG